MSLLTSLIVTLGYSQNIYSVLHHNRDEAIKGKIPNEIIEENIFYNPSGKEIKKNKKRLNSKKRILLEERYNQAGKLEARLTFSYDSSGRVVAPGLIDERCNDFNQTYFRVTR